MIKLNKFNNYFHINILVKIFYDHYLKYFVIIFNYYINDDNDNNY